MLATKFKTTSDRRAKTEIENLDINDLEDRLMSLKAKSFYWKTDEEQKDPQHGFIAQEVQE